MTSDSDLEGQRRVLRGVIATGARGTARNRRGMVGAALCVAFVLSGCTSLRPVPLEQGAINPPRHAVPGRSAEVVLRNGEVRVVRIISADANGIVADPGDGAEPLSIPYAEMQSLQVRRFSWGRTGGVVAGAIALTAGLLYFIVAQIAEDSD